MRDVIIFGTASQARLADHYFTTDSDRRVAGFTVDRAHLADDTFLGRPVVAFEDVAESHPPSSYDMFVALGYTDMSRLRAAKYHAAKTKGYQLATYISSRCSYLAEGSPGDNCLILEDNTIQPFVTIGNNVTLWSGNHIGHDVEIGDHVFVSSHVVISGFTRIEPYCFLGVNATLRDGITIAEATLVGAGAVIMSDTEPGSVYVPERAAKLDISSDDVEIS